MNFFKHLYKCVTDNHGGSMGPICVFLMCMCTYNQSIKIKSFIAYKKINLRKLLRSSALKLEKSM